MPRAWVPRRDGNTGVQAVAGLSPSAVHPSPCPSPHTPGMSMKELMAQGRKDVAETDATLGRAEKLVEDTLQIGQQVGGACMSVGEEKAASKTPWLPNPAG